jgi:hypothetical protein
MALALWKCRAQFAVWLAARNGQICLCEVWTLVTQRWRYGRRFTRGYHEWISDLLFQAGAREKNKANGILSVVPRELSVLLRINDSNNPSFTSIWPAVTYTAYCEGHKTHVRILLPCWSLLNITMIHRTVATTSTTYVNPLRSFGTGIHEECGVDASYSKQR